jgi:hypothetical protein
LREQEAGNEKRKGDGETCGREASPASPPVGAPVTTFERVIRRSSCQIDSGERASLVRV